MAADNTFTLAMLSFFSTTVDDFCVILIFYAREYVKTHSISDPQTVVSLIKISIGQFIGFTIIVGLSLVLGLGLHSVVNNDYIDLIGLLPILLGLYKIYEILEEAGKISQVYKMCCVGSYTAIGSETDESPRSKSADSTAETFESESNTADEEKDVGDVELMPVVVISGESVDVQEASEEIDVILDEEALETLESVDNESTCFVYARKIFFFLDPLTFEVAIYALMFGTDNIAIYVALFSNVSLLETLAVCLFFYAMLVLYLIMALFIIIQCPKVGKFIGNNANYLVPVVLITLGLFIVHDSIIWHAL